MPQQHLLRPADVGSLLAAGILTLSVFARPKVFIQPTGSEIISAGRAAEAGPGQIVEFNGAVLAGMVEQCGAKPILREVLPDEYDSFKSALSEAVDSPADVILIIAGSSAGSEDYTAAVIEELGEVLAHGVAMMPGKPDSRHREG